MFQMQIKALEDEFDDDTESIITNERYTYISSIIGDCVKKAQKKDKLTTSDKIDRVVTNRMSCTSNLCCNYVSCLLYFNGNSWFGMLQTGRMMVYLVMAVHLFGIGTSALLKKHADDYTADVRRNHCCIWYRKSRIQKADDIDAEAIDLQRSDAL